MCTQPVHGRTQRRRPYVGLPSHTYTTMYIVDVLVFAYRPTPHVRAGTRSAVLMNHQSDKASSSLACDTEIITISNTIVFTKCLPINIIIGYIIGNNWALLYRTIQTTRLSSSTRNNNVQQYQANTSS